MADRPILFSGPMIRALLDGRKTQTRRVVMTADEIKRGPWVNVRQRDFGWQVGLDGINSWKSIPVRFAKGDRLWVRETWRAELAFDWTKPAELPKGKPVYYEAGGGSEESIPECAGKTRVSIHMPRWASRLTLTVSDVRVQRLQEITEENAKAEGVRQMNDGSGVWVGREGPGKFVTPWPTAREAYADLWDWINGPRAWDSNPWVVAVTFAVTKGNINEAGEQGLA